MRGVHSKKVKKASYPIYQPEEFESLLDNADPEMVPPLVLLFAREYSKVNNISQPFTFFGPMDYVSHQGEKPINITWRLQYPMPPDLLPCYLRAAV